MLSNTSDAVVALGRISKFLLAEELAESYKIDPGSKYAVDVDGDFAWETIHNPDRSAKSGLGKRGARTPAEKKPSEAKQKKQSFWRKRKPSGPILPTATTKDTATKSNKLGEKPFELNGVQLKIPKGSFVAIVGRVGSGKVCQVSFCFLDHVTGGFVLEFSLASSNRRDAES